MIYTCIVNDSVLCAARFLTDKEFKKVIVKIVSGDDSIQLSDNGNFFYNQLNSFSNEKKEKHSKQMSGIKKWNEAQKQNSHKTAESKNENNEEVELYGAKWKK